MYRDHGAAVAYFLKIAFLLAVIDIDSARNIIVPGNAKQNLTYTGYNGESFTVTVCPYNRMRETNQTITLTNIGRGSVRLHFIDFDIRNSSIVRIHDGTSTSDTGSIWLHNSSNPVYASSGSSLYVIFKSGNWSYSEFDQHIGFRINCSFTEGFDRSLWNFNDLPSTGFCGDLQPSLYRGDGSSITIFNSKDTTLDVHCSWLVARQAAYLVVIPPDDSWVDYLNKSIKVRDEHSLIEGSLVEPSLLQEGDGVYFLYEMSRFSDGFHIELNGVKFPASGSKLKFGYSQNMEFSKTLAETVVEQQNSLKKCPYKTCPSTLKCVDYWDSCLEGKDGTCDYYNIKKDRYKECPSNGHCYHDDIDVCDGLVDCLDGSREDEQDCIVEEVNWFIELLKYGAVAAGIFGIAFFSLVCSKEIKKLCINCKDRCSDCCDSCSSDARENCCLCCRIQHQAHYESRDRPGSSEMSEAAPEAHTDQTRDAAGSNHTANTRVTRHREHARHNSGDENDLPPPYEVATEDAPSYEDVIKKDGKQYI